MEITDNTETLKNALKEIESLKKERDSTVFVWKEAEESNERMEKEIESLQSELKESRKEWMPQQTQNYAVTQDNLKLREEIESLRSRIKQLSTESDRLETGVRKAWKERDEYKRRFDMLWEWMQSGYTYPNGILYAKDFIQIHPEAAQWYEEE